jgi:hypothetical protein
MERQKTTNKQAKELLDASFIREIPCTTWLSILVFVKKVNQMWQICMDYADLKKACPKSPCPLPSISKLMDNSSGF